MNATKSVNNKKIITYLHSGVALQTVQGPVQFATDGENTREAGLHLPVADTASSSRCCRHRPGARIGAQADLADRLN